MAKNKQRRRGYAMNKKTINIRRNLSLFIFIVIYLMIAIILISLESFQVETQLNVISAFVPFFLLGMILDFIVARNSDLKTGYKILTQLMPAGIFILFGLAAILSILGKPIDTIYYVIWIFIALPFFINSYIKDNYRKRMLSSLIGTALIVAVYIQLTNVTDELDNGKGLILYLISIFMIFYAASRLKNFFFIGIILGFIDALILIFLWKNPVTNLSKLYGWDYEIAFQFEILLLSNFIICIIICFIDVLIRKKK